LYDFLYDILLAINNVSKKLQSTSMCIDTAIKTIRIYVIVF